MNPTRRKGSLTIMIALFLVMLSPAACAGGGSAEEEPEDHIVTRTIVANPEEMQQVFMDVAD
ncbi:MAG: hypothetical protein ACOCY8_07340, partial [Spirochaetota bacterium]